MSSIHNSVKRHIIVIEVAPSFCRNRRSPSHACLIAIFIRAKSSDRFGPRRDSGEAKRSVRKSRRFLRLVQKQRVGMIRKVEAEAEADHSKWSKKKEAQSLARNAEQQQSKRKAKSKKNNNQREKKLKKISTFHSRRVLEGFFLVQCYFVGVGYAPCARSCNLFCRRRGVSSAPSLIQTTTCGHHHRLPIHGR